MKKFIEVFKTELAELSIDDNLVIGGSHALQQHGLNLGDWRPDDLDVIIFSPTTFQIDYVKNKFNQCADEYMIDELEDKAGKEVEPRSYKLTKGMFVMNIIFAYDESMPTDLLFFFHEGVYWRINSISNIIDAKLSYSRGENKAYLRQKDIHHMMLLKNYNFNVVKMPTMTPKPTPDLSW